MSQTLPGRAFADSRLCTNGMRARPAWLPENGTLMRLPKPWDRKPDINNVGVNAWIDGTCLGVRQVVVLVTNREGSARCGEELYSTSEVEGEIKLRRGWRRHLASKVKKSRAAVDERLQRLVSEIQLKAKRISSGTKNCSGWVPQHLSVDRVKGGALRLQSEGHHVRRIFECQRSMN